MEHKVRKGLESNFLIYGCSVQSFYLLIGCGATCILFVLTDMLTSLKSGQFLAFLIHLILIFGAFISIWILLAKNSKKPKYNFGKSESTISNKDILNYL